MHINGIDEVDNQILELLKENARYSYSEIADKVGLSRVAIKNRITDMEDIGLIQGYQVKIAPNKVANSVEFIVTVYTKPTHFDYIVGILAKSNYITKLNAVTGDCKLIAYGLAPDTKEMDIFYNKLRRILTDVKFLSFDVVASTYKDVDGGIEYEGTREECTENARGTDN